MTGFFIAAAVAAVLTLGVHLFVGSRLVVRPLLAARDLTPASRWMMFMCWHVTSLALVAVAGGYLWAAMRPEAFEVAVFVTVLTAACAAFCLYVAWRARFQPWRIPAFVLLSLVALLGTLGLAG